jgi:hypothetical protein
MNSEQNARGCDFVLGTSLKVENAVLCFANDRICVVSTLGRGRKLREANLPYSFLGIA